MQLIIGNTAGFFALLGIPIILLIHLFQLELKSVRVSTLFLLNKTDFEDKKGARIQFIENSLPLWLQLLGVLLITWIMIEPRWQTNNSVQQVAVVIDASSSMNAFKNEINNDLVNRLSSLNNIASSTRWILTTTDTREENLYTGNSFDEFKNALKSWEPNKGTHDFSQSLKIAQSLSGTEGKVIFVSDHDYELPSGMEIFALGKKIQNVGFTGLNFTNKDDQVLWQTLIKNYGTEPQERSWWIESNNQKSKATKLLLQPGEIRSLEGKFPPDQDSATLVLSNDDFKLDNKLPFVKTKNKKIKVYIEPIKDFEEPLENLVNSLDNVERTNTTEEADTFLVGNLTAELVGDKVSKIVFPIDKESITVPGKSWIVPEKHYLTKDLNWQSLIITDYTFSPLKNDLQTLLWHNNKSLITYSEKYNVSNLNLQFNINSSNAWQQPAFILLLHRFLEKIRRNKIANEVKNFEANQLLNISVDRIGEDINIYKESELLKTIPAIQANIIRAPIKPSFFKVKQGKQEIITGASYFADTREADFKNALTFNGISKVSKELKLKHSQSDFLLPIWILLLILLFLTNWHYSRN